MSLKNGTSKSMGNRMYGKKRRGREPLIGILAILIAFMCLVIICYAAIPDESGEDTGEQTQTTATTTVTQISAQPSVTPTPVITEIKEEPFYFEIPLENDLQDYIRTLCAKYNVPMELVIAMCERESSFRAGVISKSNDYGLMQINTINHQWLTEKFGITDFLDPYQNVLAGIYILSGHLTATDGDIELALMRYNNGATGAKRLWSQGIYSTTYTSRIMESYEKYQKESRTGDDTLSTAK